MTKPKRYKRFSSEFKREAIRRAAEERGVEIQHAPDDRHTAAVRVLDLVLRERPVVVLVVVDEAFELMGQRGRETLEMSADRNGAGAAQVGRKERSLVDVGVDRLRRVQHTVDVEIGPPSESRSKATW